MTTKVKAPGLVIELNGKPMSEEDLSRVSEITFQDQLNESTMFTMSYAISDFRGGAWHGVDSFDIGDTIKINFGFEKPMEFQGYITALEPTFGPDAKLNIRGYDPLYTMKFGTRTRSFFLQTDSMIVEDVVSGAGISANVDPLSLPHEYVLQDNISDFEFISQRAQANFYDFQYRDGAFHFFVSPFLKGLEAKIGLTTPLELEYKTDFDEFSATYQSDELGSAVVVQGYDQTNAAPVFGVFGENIEATVIAGLQAEVQGGAQLAAEALLSPGASSVILSDMAYGTLSIVEATAEAALAESTLKLAGISNPAVHFSKNSPIFVTDSTVTNQLQAEAAAIAAYMQKLVPYITGNGDGIGNSAIRAGGFLNLKGLGKRFSGPYYIESTQHTWNIQSGYKTSFSAKRNWMETALNSL